MHSTLSLTGKRWMLQHPRLPDDLLRLRGLETSSPLPSLSIFPDARKACDRVHAAVKRRERIAIFGDYDCDGVTSAAQLVRFFRRRGIEPSVRLPHRARDGYGLKPHVAQEFLEQKTSLLITVDTGISSASEIRTLTQGGTDVIILDHHRLPQTLPQAFAILHPALAPGFPEPHPSAAGIAFLFVTALEGDVWEGKDEDAALAAIGTIADLVELRGCNRTLAAAGLDAFSRIRTGPLAALRAHVSTGEPRATDIAFRIAPRINAAGRMADPCVALKALLEGGDCLHELECLNAERQRLTAEIFAELERQYLPPSMPMLCAYSAAYPPGIIGLLAGKLTSASGRPSLVAHIQGETCTGSLRSIPAYDIVEGLGRACGDLLTSFGGHAQAAGCTFPALHFPAISERLCRDVRTHVADEELVPSLAIEAQVEAADLSLHLCEALRLLEPFGQGNPAPRFLLRNALVESPRLVGSDATHLQARIAGRKAIGFRLGHLLSYAKQPLDIVFQLDINEWQGKREPQLMIEDMREALPLHTGASVPSISKTSVTGTSKAAAIL